MIIIHAENLADARAQLNETENADDSRKKPLCEYRAGYDRGYKDAEFDLRDKKESQCEVHRYAMYS